MKTIIKATATILTILTMTACSSDDSKDAPEEEPLSEKVEYVFSEPTQIASDGFTIIDLEVGANAKIIDPTKITLELRLSHQQAMDVDFTYVPPDGDGHYILIGAGGYNKFNPNSTLTFRSSHTQMIADEYPNNTIPTGDYTSTSFDNEIYPVEKPLFNSLLNKNTEGTWKFVFSDVGDTESGDVYWIKLIFEEGALEVNP